MTVRTAFRLGILSGLALAAAALAFAWAIAGADQSAGVTPR